MERRIVGVITAAGVLLCSIYCACGDAAHHSLNAAEAHLAASGHSEQRHRHCHAHPAAAALRHGVAGHDGAPTPCRHPDGGNGCGHCDASLGRAEQASPALVAHALVPSGFAPWAVATLREQMASHLPACSGDLPPPPGQPTLLNLHCTLNT